MAIVSIRNPCRRCGKPSTRIARLITVNGELVTAIICTRCVSAKELRRMNRENRAEWLRLGEQVRDYLRARNG